ncbi:unnamed protein product [Trichobilharzia szidati]|nr:unnamed protein product [Trichobilharzia szidati]
MQVVVIMYHHFPITTCPGDGAPVPPVSVYASSSGITSENLLSGSHVVGPSTSQNDEMPSNRGRPSTVPVEIREEEIRRLKKIKRELRRRASISDKMNALHSLAMELIGINFQPDESQKLEKVVMLSLCYTVLELVANIAKDKPELQARFKKLRRRLYKLTSSSSIRNDIPSSPASMSSSSTSRSTKKLHKFTKSLYKVAITATATATADNRRQEYELVTNRLSEEEYSVVNFSPSSSPQSTQLVIDEENKENMIPKLIIKNAFSNKSCAVVKTITTNSVQTTTTTTPINFASCDANHDIVKPTTATTTTRTSPAIWRPYLD